MARYNVDVEELVDQNGNITGYRGICEGLNVIEEAQNMEELNKKLKQSMQAAVSQQIVGNEEAPVEEVPGEDKYVSNVLTEGPSSDNVDQLDQFIQEFDSILEEIMAMYSESRELINDIVENETLPRAYAAVNVLYAIKNIANINSRNQYLIGLINALDTNFVDSHSAVRSLLQVFDSVERENP